MRDRDPGLMLEVPDHVIKIPEDLAHELDRVAGAEHKRRAIYAIDVCGGMYGATNSGRLLDFPRVHGIQTITRSWPRAGRTMLKRCVLEGSYSAGLIRHFRPSQRAVLRPGEEEKTAAFLNGME